MGTAAAKRFVFALVSRKPCACSEEEVCWGLVASFLLRIPSKLPCLSHDLLSSSRKGWWSWGSAALPAWQERSHVGYRGWWSLHSSIAPAAPWWGLDPISGDVWVPLPPAEKTPSAPCSTSTQENVSAVGCPWSEIHDPRWTNYKWLREHAGKIADHLPKTSWTRPHRNLFWRQMSLLFIW